MMQKYLMWVPVLFAITGKLAVLQLLFDHSTGYHEAQLRNVRSALYVKSFYCETLLFELRTRVN